MKKLVILVVALSITSALFADEVVVFHDFPWGTSIDEFTKKMGKPVSRENYNGLTSLVYDNLIISGYQAFMLVYFSKNGLEGGTYYFNTFNIDELMECYKTVQKELIEKYGPTALCDIMFKEMRPFESSWKLKSGYVYLKVNTRQNDPVTLWYSSPTLTKMIMGS